MTEVTFSEIPKCQIFKNFLKTFYFILEYIRLTHIFKFQLVMALGKLLKSKKFGEIIELKVIKYFLLFAIR